MDNRLSVHVDAANVKSADRVLDVFELLCRWDRELPHADLANALNIPKSSLTMLLRTLISRGYVDFSPINKSYRLGVAFSRLACQSGGPFDLTTCATPLLTKITSLLGESSALNRLKNQQAEVVATVRSPHRLLYHMRLGDLAPLYATSGGKAILAYLPEDMQQEYLNNVGLEAITPRTLRSAAELKRELEAIRRTGFSHSFEEFTPGIVGIATAVLDQSGQLLGSLNVAMPLIRSTPKVLERAAHALRSAAVELRNQAMSSRHSTRS